MAPRQGYTALTCPACGEGQLWISDEALSCRRCRETVAEDRGIYALNAAHDDTAASYASIQAGLAPQAFFPAENARMRHFRDLDLIVGQVLGGRNIAETLELGGDGGAWTWGLAHDGRYQRVYASDTSPTALAHLADLTEGTGAMILDTAPGALRIAPNSLDLVVGRATLCREMDPEAMLSRVRQWLKPGGAAIFLEPCLQGKIWAAFVMDAIRRFEAQSPQSAPSENGAGSRLLGRGKTQRKTLSQLAQLRLEGSTRQILRGTEGKRAGEERVFDMTALTSMGFEAGFNECFPIDQPQEDATPLQRMRNTLDGLLGPEKTILERYLPIFEALEATFGALPETSPVAPNLYFVFRA